MKNDGHVWDNKKPTAQMLGRWQPWHAGHQKLFEEILKKTGQVNILTSKVSVKNRNIILVDDMISTGVSIIKSTQFLKKQKCKRIFVACTHALLVNDAEKRIRNAGVSQIISTNTIPRKTSKVDVSKIIAESIL